MRSTSFATCLSFTLMLSAAILTISSTNAQAVVPDGAAFSSDYATSSDGLVVHLSLPWNYNAVSSKASRHASGIDVAYRAPSTVNFYNSTLFSATNNYIMGGHSLSGCGLIMDYAASSGTFTGNIIYNTGQCGIGVANGMGQTVSGNSVLMTNPVSGTGNTAIYIWNQYSAPCGGVLLGGNIATEIRTDGTASGYWNGGGCSPVTCDGTNVNVDACNVFDYSGETTAYDLLVANSKVTTPPLIPPQPKHCVAKSPYSTQVSLPQCQ